ncbi:MAG TPA: phosphoribosylformylglycinamidine synthase subunit PurQ [Dongiaceae bacterium]|jgi:phosphoribosylformylglycinamidine synthase|nr:phosphoribosylformylglycinamidine synthase subunit PurQ [Dongiaceae bacterium]
MKAAIVVFPGSNRERDVARAMRDFGGIAPIFLWHGETDMPDVDIVVLPGGFAYGDYLRAGAIAARAPIMAAVRAHAARGGYVLGICNGFQILTEAGLLPGILRPNAERKFICRFIQMRVEQTDSVFTRAYRHQQVITVPIAHHDGNYFAPPEMASEIEANGQVAFRYCDAHGRAADVNGSLHAIAGLFNARRNVLGLMPHPENAIATALGSSDGAPFFSALGMA